MKRCERRRPKRTRPAALRDGGGTEDRASPASECVGDHNGAQMNEESRGPQSVIVIASGGTFVSVAMGSTRMQMVNLMRAVSVRGKMLVTWPTIGWRFMRT